MATSKKYLLSFQRLSLNEIMKLLLNIEGVKNADKGDFDDTLECFSKAIKLPPDDTISYFNRASLRMFMGDVKGAKSDIKSLKTRTLTGILSWAYHIIIILAILKLFL